MNAIVFLSFFLPCVSAFNPAAPAVKVNAPSAFRLPVTQATDVLDAPQTLPADAAVHADPGHAQIMKQELRAVRNDVMKKYNAQIAKEKEMMEMMKQYNMMKEKKDLLDKPKPMPAQVQEMKPAQAQAAAAAAEPESSIFQQPVFMGASIAGLFASMFGAAGLVLHRRKAERKRTDSLAANAAAVALALASATAGATPAFAGNAANGETVFSGNCAACHAGGNNVIQAEKTLKKAALTEYLAGGFKEESIVYQVTNGKNAMPAFGGRLSDEEIGDVAAYVYKTSNADSWE